MADNKQTANSRPTLQKALEQIKQPNTSSRLEGVSIRDVLERLESVNGLNGNMALAYRVNTKTGCSLLIMNETVTRAENQTADNGMGYIYAEVENGKRLFVDDELVFVESDEQDESGAINCEPLMFVEGWQVTLEDLLHSALLLAMSEKMLAEMDREESDSIPKQDTNKPRKHVDPITKLAQRITSPQIWETGGAILDVASQEEKKQGKTITTALSVSLEDTNGVSMSRPMSQYDVDVNGAVATLWQAGNKNITIPQVFKTLTGETGKPSDKQLAEISESLDKQFRAFVEIDFTQEARGRSLEFEGEAISEGKLKAHMLEARGMTMRTANGKTVEGYELLAPPVLYQHAAMLGQVVTYPQRLLQIGGRNTQESIVIKKYMLRRIGQIKGKGHVSNRIKFEAIYEKAGIENPSKDKRRKVRDYVRELLNGLVETGYIAGYSEVEEKRTIAAVDIEI